MDLNHKLDEILRKIHEIERYTLDFRYKGDISDDELTYLNNKVSDLYKELKQIQSNHSDKQEVHSEPEKPFQDQHIPEQKLIGSTLQHSERFKLAIDRVISLSNKLKRQIFSLRTLLIAITLFTSLIAFIGYNIFHGKYGELPDKLSLKNIKQAQATEIYSSDGVLMGRYYFENRNSILNEHIPTQIIHALLATEDVRYFEHDGIDTRSMFRVLFRSVLMGDESSGGGSTITQQLARNLYPRKGNSSIALISTKLREMIIAKRLESSYTKEQLLLMYLNTVPFGEYTFGIKNASLLYFNKLPYELTLEQACTLVGMLKGTTYYNPHKNPERAIERRNVVLSQMSKYDYLDTASMQKLIEKPLGINYHPVDHNHGIAPYLREYLRPTLEEWCKRHKKPNGESYNLYADGLKIYTTIDSRLQKYAAEAVNKKMPRLQKIFDRQKDSEENQKYQSLVKQIISGIPDYQSESIWNSESPLFKEKSMEVFTWDTLKTVTMSPIDSVKHYLSLLNAGFLAMNPHNSHILAWVGGIDHRYFKYDHVTSKRQVGSTFKPIVYANALQKGGEPCDYFPNDKIFYDDYENWTPHNANHKYGGVYSLQNALANSINTISVQLLMNSGIESTIQLARKLGITSDFPPVPSLGLGAITASVKEMAEAYASFVNNGEPSKGKVLLRIENSDGDVLETFNLEERSEKAMDGKTAELITMMLHDVVKSGTASSLSRNFSFNGDVAGKTGTTQSQADGWFVGFTPNLVFASWVGAEYPIVHMNSLKYGQGAATALPIAGNFLNDLYDNDPGSKYFGKFQYRRINISEYDCRGYFAEEDMEEVIEKTHYLRRTPGLAGCWFGTSHFDEIKEDKLVLKDMDRDWGSDHEGHKDWAIAWKGAIEAPHSGEIKFHTESSGKVKLSIDNNLIISGRGKSSGKLFMNKGMKYPITITHAQSRKAAHLRVYWEWTGHDETIISGDYLFHNQQDIKAIRLEND